MQHHQLRFEEGFEIVAGNGRSQAAGDLYVPPAYDAGGDMLRPGTA
jgi:hypothetical protein